MRIEINQTVKHGGRTYSAGDQITVDEQLGAYLCTCGWAKRLDGETPPASPPPPHVELEVQNAVMGHKAKEI